MTKGRIKAAAAAIITAAMLSGLVPSVYADNTAIGYGQGTAADSSNCPVDAVSFDQNYRKYNAYATTPDRQRIIITLM